MRFIVPLTLACIALLPGVASAAEGVICHGCSSLQMSQSATKATDQGTVYVFNRVSAEVRKFRVFTEIIDESPYTTWTQAAPRSTEQSVQNAWQDYLHSTQNLRESGIIRLPGDFPVRSVAGAFLDPAYSTTAIEDYLLTLTAFHQLELTMSALLSKLMQVKIPMVDVPAILKAIVITLEFPDGSSQDYAVSWSSNALSGEARLELEVHGNAHTAEGRAAPMSRTAFDGHRFIDRDGSLREWMAWARQLGLVVSGSGTTMECVVEKDTIYCRVRGKK